MNVYGDEVTLEVEKAVLAAMKGEFVARDIEKAAIAAGIPEVIRREWSQKYCAHRVADRLLQRERKAGRISRRGGKWVANAKLTCGA